MEFCLAGLLLLACLSLAAAGPGSLEFIQEELEFKLDQDWFKVNGNYWFSNNTGNVVIRQLFFPIPADSLNAPAERVKLKLKDPLPGQKVKILSVSQQGFWFELSLPAQTIAECHISYRQKLKGNSARYVLRSTQSWGKPLELAKYTLITSNKLQVLKLTLSDPEISVRGGRRCFRWEYQNYLPDTDFEVEFR